MPTWTIEGESGKSFPATTRTIGNDLGMVSAKVTFRSCGVDTFVYTMEVESSTPSTDIPELTQTVTLFRNGTRYFHGHVTDIKERSNASSSTLTVTVSGPWFYAENIPLTVSQTDGIGVASDRPGLILTGFSTSQSILTYIIDRGIALGVPWQRGTISSSFQMPPQTYNQHSVAEGITEMVRMVPDAMQWIDYSTTPPTINVTRRGVATTRTIAATDCTSYEINPVIQLAVTQVNLPYASRAANGSRVHLVQTAGSFTVGKTGWAVISGPEVDTFLPPDDPVESYQIQTVATGATQAQFEGYLLGRDPTVLRLNAEFGLSWYGNNNTNDRSTLNVGNGEIVQYFNSQQTSGGGTGNQFVAFAPTFINNSGLPVSGHFIYDTSGIPDWVATKYNAVKVTYEYLIYVVREWRNSVYGSAPPNVLGLADFASGAGFWQGYWNVFGSSRDRISIFWIKPQGEGLVIQSSFPAGATIYKPVTYTFTAPPADLAANLLTAQSWTPYEGNIEINEDDVGGTRYRGCKIDLTGSRVTAHATMGALVSAEEVDLFSNVLSISLGAPPRINFQQFMDKIRQPPQANIDTSP